MPSINLCAKRGFTLTEIMMALAILGLLSLGMFGNVMMHHRSFRYNLASNENIQDSSLALQRVVYGDANHWGLRTASRSRTTVAFTGLSGANGSLGWQAEYSHNIPVNVGTPPHMVNPTQTLTYNPVAQTLTLNTTVIANNVVDARFTFNGTGVTLALQTENDTFGLQSLVETQCTLRNR